MACIHGHEVACRQCWTLPPVDQRIGRLRPTKTVGRIWFNPRTQLWHGHAYGGRFNSCSITAARAYMAMENQYRAWLHDHLLALLRTEQRIQQEVRHGL